MRAKTALCRAVLILTCLILPPAAVLISPVDAASPWYVAASGSDSNSCSSPSAPCATINGAIGKALPGDTIYVTAETYTGSGSYVVELDKSLNLFGGWDQDFVGRAGLTTIDGQDQRTGLFIALGVTTRIERFLITAGRTGPSAMGGGIADVGYDVTLQECEVRNSYASYGGGGIVQTARQGILRLNSSSVSGNSTDEDGGGIYSEGSLVLTNSTVSDNRAGKTIYSGLGRGGGVFATGPVSLYSSTVTDNRTLFFAAGGIDRSQTSGSMHTRNSIIAGNTAAGAPSDYYGLLVSDGHNLFGSTSGLIQYQPGPGDVVNLAAILGLLQGTPGYRPLLPNSPAIDAGDPQGCVDGAAQLIPADQRGFPRFRTCDIGAYELQPLGFSVKTSSVTLLAPRQSLTCTIALQNHGLTNLPGVRVTDTLPVSLTYTLGSLSATAGAVQYADGVISWAGTVGAGQEISVTFGASVGSECGYIHNNAIISGGGDTYTRTATTRVVYQAFLPITTKGSTTTTYGPLQQSRARAGRR